MADDVLIVIDQQKAMDHPKWAPRNNPAAEANIARLLANSVEATVRVAGDLGSRCACRATPAGRATSAT